MTLPKHLQEKCEYGAELISIEIPKKHQEFTRFVYTSGFTACYSEALLETAGEFDEGSIRKKIADEHQCSQTEYEIDFAVKGARLQHQQTQALLAAREAEIARLKHACNEAIIDSSYHPYVVFAGRIIDLIQKHAEAGNIGNYDFLLAEIERARAPLEGK